LFLIRKREGKKKRGAGLGPKREKKGVRSTSPQLAQEEGKEGTHRKRALTIRGKKKGRRTKKEKEEVCGRGIICFFVFVQGEKKRTKTTLYGKRKRRKAKGGGKMARGSSDAQLPKVN